MSYDIYCYKSKTNTPNINEAASALEEMENFQPDMKSQELKTQICKALIDFNPRLEPFAFDYNEIARLQNISVDEAKNKFSHIELNTPEGDLATQITIFDNNVSLTIPYWYTGDKAREVFNKVDQYLKIINQKAGYFVYDPQTEHAYDPAKDSLAAIAVYESVTTQIGKRVSENVTTNKPWWKFW